MKDSLTNISDFITEHFLCLFLNIIVSTAIVSAHPKNLIPILIAACFMTSIFYVYGLKILKRKTNSEKEKPEKCKVRVSKNVKFPITNGLGKLYLQGWIVLPMFFLGYRGIPLLIIWIFMQNRKIWEMKLSLKSQTDFDEHVAKNRKQLEEEAEAIYQKTIDGSVKALQDEYERVMKKRNKALKEYNDFIDSAMIEATNIMDLAEKKSQNIISSAEDSANKLIANANNECSLLRMEIANNLDDSKEKLSEAEKEAYYIKKTAENQAKEFIDAYKQNWLKTNFHSSDVLDALETETKEKLIEIDNLVDGHDFEYYFADILRVIGYDNVEVTKGSGDMGADVLASRDGVRYSIQCKRYTNRVDVAAVQQAASGRDYYKCNIAVVVTNSTYTRNALELAQRLSVVMWDRAALEKLVFQYCRRKYILDHELDHRNA